MAIVALGLNHSTAPLRLREQVSVAPDRLAHALHALRECRGVSEAAILSTCNRTDLYCGLESAERSEAPQWFERFHGLAGEHVEPHLYHHTADGAVRHVMRVASGLDSMVLGEPQILGQLKQAYSTALEHGAMGPILDKLFQRSFTVAKRVRTDTRIGSSPVSVAYAAVTLAKRIFGDFSQRTALLVGAGETIELCARHLGRAGIGRIIVANRTVSRARRIALEHQGYAIGLPEIAAHLGEADIVISSTGSPDPVIGLHEVESAIRSRKHRPVFMADLAVPHDIDRGVSELDDVYLYNVDDLADVIDEGKRSREAAAIEAERIVDVHVGEFMDWLGTRQVGGLVRDLRACAGRHRDEVLAKAHRMIERGTPPDKALEFLANTLTNKVLHAPTVQIRRAGAEQSHHVLEAARLLFGLDDQEDAEERAGPEE